MIVTCSNCRARYAVDPLAIGPNGRTVQCVRCNHRWFQQVEGQKPAPDLVIRPPERGTSLPVPVAAQPKPSWDRRLALAAVIAILMTAAGVGAYRYRDMLIAYRDMIVSLVPNDLHFLQSAGSPHPPGPVARAPAPAPAPTPNTPSETSASTPSGAPATAPASAKAAPAPEAPAPAQLEVDLSASKIDLVDGHYVVRGEIANNGGSPGTTSKLIVTFKKGDDVLATRTYPLVLGPIAAGDRMSFSQTLDNPPAGATDIVPSVQ